MNFFKRKCGYLAGLPHCPAACSSRLAGCFTPGLVAVWGFTFFFLPHSALSITLFVCSCQDQFNFNNLVTVWIQKDFVKRSTPSHTHRVHTWPDEYTPRWFFMSSKHYSSLSQRAWLLSPDGSYDTILTQEMVYNKNICAPIKRQKSTILRKTKTLEIAHLIGDVAFEALSFVCFAMSQRDKAEQSYTI